jgi:uncharacterized protein involved in tolerance to divalent cations
MGDLKAIRFYRGLRHVRFEEEALRRQFLVQERLLLWVNLVSPIHSIYRGRKDLGRRECLLMIKTKENDLGTWRNISSPFIYSTGDHRLAQVEGSSSYLRWVDEMIR